MYEVRVPPIFYALSLHTGESQHYTDERGVTFEVGGNPPLAHVVSCPSSVEDPWHKDLPSLSDLVRDRVNAWVQQVPLTVNVPHTSSPGETAEYSLSVYSDGRWLIVFHPMENTEAEETGIRKGVCQNPSVAMEMAKASMVELAVDLVFRVADPFGSRG